ncbi:phosphogluconate dehydrogenase (NADP(+)-dependent, decarboxylating) [Acidihalobacter aeolianus]|uniref:6-phosphogluconate dehydrogenase, decarboxylating n=1 Tax=Acidihalobacter aeolianus TaxID=2792603 RepID=A0A1D8K845_9GAMM|nr:NADP-dependent phosphogluconate dehydrogenase [Acidihalobacter aeolianus]AOV17116.1 phosphogluconate dehydrogenase (NADP(+)-dependent, decarboxylating) [Acidihalobacter aeolianus]
MATSPFDIGVVGLGVMGANLGLNLASRGARVAGYNHSRGKADAFTARAAAELDRPDQAQGTDDLNAFIVSLTRPRIVLLMVPAGVVDDAIAQISPHLQAGDIVIDGGNSHFPDTERRLSTLAGQDLHFIGMGVSGGETGARFGPSMMPGGEAAAWKHVRPLLEPAAAIAPDGAPCVSWMGSGGAGHFVKMVHNGIEYALMQQIAEIYDLLHRGAGYDHADLHRLFAEWNEGTLAGYLIEITADILQQPDDSGSGLLLDKIRDAAGQKGTGRWTSEAAFELGVPTPAIDAAVTARGLSDLYAARQTAAGMLPGPATVAPSASLAKQAAAALEAGMLIAYTQGMHLIAEAAEAKGYGTSLDTVARIWRGGCIIRAALLDDLAAAYVSPPLMGNPLFDETLSARLGKLEGGLRTIVTQGAIGGIPMPALAAALAYYDGLRSRRLPANLIQAQRDYFGAHTYERLDKPGIFHTHWGTGAIPTDG